MMLGYIIFPFRQSSEENTESPETRHLGVVLSQLRFANNPQVDKFVQMAVGVEMWRLGCPQKILMTLNHMGEYKTTKVSAYFKPTSNDKTSEV